MTREVLPLSREEPFSEVASRLATSLATTTPSTFTALNLSSRRVLVPSFFSVGLEDREEPSVTRV